MKKLAYILLLLMIMSCTDEFAFCEGHDEYDIKCIKDIYLSNPEEQFESLSALDGIIQYHGSDSWGWFKHTIRVINKNGEYFIQLWDNRRNTDLKHSESVYQESMLTYKQFQALCYKMDKLMCRPVNLETAISVDGEFYELIIKRNGKLQAFKWQSIFRTKNSEENRTLKAEVTAFVGELMKLSNFPNGTKQVVFTRSRNKTDSISVEIFLRNQFNVRKSDVYYEGQKMEESNNGIVKMLVHQQDTLGIEQRIKCKVELLNGEIIEL